MTRQAFEAALDAGNLWTGIRYSGETRWYKCRRNGRTQTWKRDPSRFEIPIKFRLRDHMRVKAEYFNRGTVDHWFRISEEQPSDKINQRQLYPR